METKQIVLSEPEAVSNQQHPFTTAARGLGFTEIAEKAGVTYQTVSKMAKNPRAGRKASTRRRMAHVTLSAARERENELKAEAIKLAGTIEQLEQWVKVEFGDENEAND